MLGVIVCTLCGLAIAKTGRYLWASAEMHRLRRSAQWQLAPILLLGALLFPVTWLLIGLGRHKQVRR